MAEPKFTEDKANLTGDSFSNFVAKLGLNTHNLQSHGTYSMSPFISRNRALLESAYRSSWLVGQVVDTVAEDMTREGITMNTDLSPDSVKQLQSSLTRFKIFSQLADTLRWARLYGGAIAVILTEGADYSKPLNFDAIGRNRFKGLVVLDRWMIEANLGELVTEIGVDMGKPKYYTVLPSMPALSGQKVHYTRVIRFDGIPLPYYQQKVENLWGLSVVERMYDRLIAYDSATQGAAQLLHKAHLRTINVDGFRDALAMGGKTEAAVIKQFDYIRLLQTMEGLTVLDAKDAFQTHSYAFSGISDLLIQFGQQISGATGIPLVRLFGQSPAGLSATGESDLRNYYDHINKLQENQLRHPVQDLLEVLCRSELGITLPDDFEFDFNPLWQLSDTEKSQVTGTDVSAISSAYSAGIITKKIAMKELTEHSRITGRFTNISDEDIENAKEDVPMMGGEENPFGVPPSAEDTDNTLLDLKKQLAELEDLSNPENKENDLSVLKERLDDLESPEKVKAPDILNDDLSDLKARLEDLDSPAEFEDEEISLDGLKKRLEELDSEGISEDSDIDLDDLKERLSKLENSEFPDEVELYELKAKLDSLQIPTKGTKTKDGVAKRILQSLIGAAIAIKLFTPKKEQQTIKERVNKLLGIVDTESQITTDEQLRAPKGGVSIKGQEYKGGEFIPSSVDQEEAKKEIAKKQKENEAKPNDPKAKPDKKEKRIPPSEIRFSDLPKEQQVKYKRVDKLTSVFSTIKKDVRKRMSKDDRAFVLALIMETAIRPGYGTEARGKVKAYGATTLEGRHVKLEGKNLYLDFVGKKGVNHNILIEDPELKTLLLERKQKVGDDQRLFTVSGYQLLDYTKLLNDNLKTKDFRTYLATDFAKKVITKTKAPTTFKEYKKHVMGVAKQVSTKLGNTPAACLTLYIDPRVFLDWRKEVENYV